MIRWNFPPYTRPKWWLKTYLWLSRIHVGVCLGWRPDECMKVDIYPFSWVAWGTFPQYPNSLYLGPVMIYVTNRPFQWEPK